MANENEYIATPGMTSKKGPVQTRKKPAKRMDRKRSGPPMRPKEEIKSFAEGGYCRGGGAAIRGTNFKGVF
jgi:hypothetical protein|tara:strand:- start:741 stop:953 length:213 start_codon:yes stop_codon:yes gene_type:complete